MLLAALTSSACAVSGREIESDPTDAGVDAEPGPEDGGFTKQPDATGPATIDAVYAHSGTELYRLDPQTKAVTTVGTFSGCTKILDIALNEASEIWATTYAELYRIDRMTAQCTLVSTGTYGTSLSFVPKGTLDPNEEALVAYVDDKYIRIDTTTGNTTEIGSLQGPANMVSSGDIVSVKGGGTYLTVKGNASCESTDCVIEIDPKTGRLIRTLGNVPFKKVFGLAFWGGKAYGFTDGGDLFETTLDVGSLQVTVIPIAQKPADLKFWGAGSSTLAPLGPR